MSNEWSNDSTTSLTLPTGATDPSQRIVLDGTSDTILVYDNTGNLIASVAANAGTDGFGHSYPAGISSASGIISNSIFLLYSGTPALGNLIASITSSPGTDSFGNAYFGGFNFGNQQGAHFGVDNMGNVYLVNSAGVLMDFFRSSDGLINIGPSAGSQYSFQPASNKLDVYDTSHTLVAEWNSGVGKISFLDNVNTVAVSLNASTTTGLPINNGIAFSPISAGVVPTQTQINTGGLIGLNGTGGALDLLAPLGAIGTSRAFLRLSPGHNSQPPGGLGPSAQFSDSANNSAVDIFLSGAIQRTDSAGLNLGWQVPTITGTNFNNGGFSGELGTRYRIDAEDNLIVIVAVTASAGVAANTTTTLFTLPAAYRPAKGCRFAAYQSTGTTGTYATGIVQSGGAVIVQNPTALVANNTVQYQACIPLGNIA